MKDLVLVYGPNGAYKHLILHSDFKNYSTVKLMMLDLHLINFRRTLSFRSII